MISSIYKTLLGAAALGLSSFAQAHVGTDLADHHALSLVDGLLHPFTGLDHLAAMLAVGFWSALSTRRVWLAPLAFANMLLVGALMGMSGVALPALEPMVAATVLALGLLVATRAQFPGAVAAALAGGFAVFHGMAHGAEFVGASPVAALVGMVAGTAVLHGLGLAAGLALRAHSAWWPRLAGAALALWGGLLLAQLAG
ncbi:MAG: HupE/UreJ family protein [Betaproteobacteria bacterium]